MISTEEFMRREQMVRKARRNRWYLLALVVIVLIVVIIVSVTATNNRSSDEEPAFAINDPAVAQLLEMVETAMTKGSLDPAPLYVSTSYQSQAFNWLSKNAELASYDRSQVLQRFALACFYYATNNIQTPYTPNPSSWTKLNNWLSDEHECQWHGIECSTRLKVTAINLEENSLTGAIPIELSFLRDHLTTLDLTTNQLYVEGDSWEVFGRLTNLQTLLLDDNYLSNNDGLPSILGSCTNLKKIRLSYNLLGGSLDGSLLQKLSKLTHLEVESNYLEGPIPNELGKMDQLVYLYMRRNALSSNLNFLESGKMHNLFAMWLDANLITGTIPTQVGLLAELASLSITNATLTGTIPSEFGQLTGLRRLWLYGNELTGSIPSELANLGRLEVLEVQENKLTGTVPNGVCGAVGGSSYAHKSLAADCDKITCDNCCTHCG